MRLRNRRGAVSFSTNPNGLYESFADQLFLTQIRNGINSPHSTATLHTSAHRSTREATEPNQQIKPSKSIFEEISPWPHLSREDLTHDRLDILVLPGPGGLTHRYDAHRSPRNHASLARPRLDPSPLSIALMADSKTCHRSRFRGPSSTALPRACSVAAAAARRLPLAAGAPPPPRGEARGRRSRRCPVS